jgi:hypothetical protein
MLSKGLVEKENEQYEHYNASQQMLFSLQGNNAWWNCRDDLQNALVAAESAEFFVRPTLPVEQLAAFVRQLEAAMGIESFTKMVRAKYKIKKREQVPNQKMVETVTEHKDAMFITLSWFWTEHPLKISFFTAAIKLVDLEEKIDLSRCKTARDARRYLIEIDDDNQYFLPTKRAVRYFMSGHTKVIRSRKKSSGWRDVFDPDYNGKCRPKDHIKRILQEP